MAADSSMGFHQGIIPSFYNQHMVSFQSGTMNNNSRGLSGTGAVGTSSNAGLFLSPNSPSNLISNMPGPTIVQAGSSSSDPFCGPMPKFKFVTGLPADWSLSELAILKEGLVRCVPVPMVLFCYLVMLALRYERLSREKVEKSIRFVEVILE